MLRLGAITAVALLVAPLNSSIAQPLPAGAIRDLAEAWSGGNQPRCEKGATNEVVDGQIDPWICEWSVDIAGPTGRVKAYLDEAGRPSAVLREQHFHSSDAASRLVDSVHAAFVARGLEQHECGEADVPAGVARNLLWTSPKLVAFLTHVRAEDGRDRVMMFAIDDPAHLPKVFACHLHGSRPAE